MRGIPSKRIEKGNRFGRLVAIKYIGKSKWNFDIWLFKCECGNQKEILANSVKTKRVKSCGCLLRETTAKRFSTHGHSRSPTYTSWYAMKKRCKSKNSKDYRDYVLRGITVCKRWQKFENFFADMGERPEGMSLGRIDNNKGYYKENCRWETALQQANNKRNNALATLNGVTKTIPQWAREFNLDTEFVRNRVSSCGWSIKDAITLPKYVRP